MAWEDMGWSMMERTIDGLSSTLPSPSRRLEKNDPAPRFGQVSLPLGVKSAWPYRLARDEQASEPE